MTVTGALRRHLAVFQIEQDVTFHGYHHSRVFEKSGAREGRRQFAILLRTQPPERELVFVGIVVAEVLVQQPRGDRQRTAAVLSFVAVGVKETSTVIIAKAGDFPPWAEECVQVPGHAEEAFAIVLRHLSVEH